MMYIAASPVHVAVRSTGEDGSNESEGDAKSKKKAADKKKKAIKSPDSEDEEDEIEEAWDNTTNSVKSQVCIHTISVYICMDSHGLIFQCSPFVGQTSDV